MMSSSHWITRWRCGMCPKRARGSALMIALFVIVVMGGLAAALGRLLGDSSEKYTVEVRGLRALMAAQGALETGLYRLYPNGHWQGQVCEPLTLTLPNDAAGLVDCRASLSCDVITAEHNGRTLKGWRLIGTGECGDEGGGASPDFAVSRSVMAEAFDSD